MGVGVDGLLTDEAPHVLGQLGIFDQRERLVVGGDEPALGDRQDDVEQTDHVRRDGMAGNPFQGDAGDVEVHFPGVNLHRAGVDLPDETAWPQHDTSGVRVVSPELKPEKRRRGSRQP